MAVKKNNGTYFLTENGAIPKIRKTRLSIWVLPMEMNRLGTTSAEAWSLQAKIAYIAR